MISKRGICTGCSACFNICPKNCIQMKENNYGEICAYIDEKYCIHCKKCEKICPNNRELVANNSNLAFISWRKDKKACVDSASGGIASVISEKIIRDGGIVYGASYAKSMELVCTRITQLDELEKLKGSKYLQSAIGYCFRSIKRDLENGYKVLFISTPCQVNGLYAYLKEREYENLFTCDLVCHGVAPYKYFKEEVLYLKEKYKLKSIQDVRFRGKFDFCFTMWGENNQLLLKKSHKTDYYFMPFLKGINLRESCYSCIYAQNQRISDITLGDSFQLIKSLYKIKNTKSSNVLINTEKGQLLFDSILSEIISIKCSVEDVINDSISFRQPFPRHNKSLIFKENYRKFGYSKGIRKTIGKEIFICHIDRILSYLKRRLIK